MPDDNSCGVVRCVLPDDLALFSLNGPAPPPIPPGVATDVCRVIRCAVPDDLMLSSLVGPAPLPTPPGVAPDVCRVIQCIVPDDLRLFSLSGLPPLPPTNVRGQPVGNAEVYYDFPCESGEITYDGTLPSWITIDTENDRLVGAANTFYQGSQAMANNAAQTALNDFATAAIGAGTLTCGEEPDACESDTNQYAIDGYVDGQIDNSVGNPPAGGEVVWDGEYIYKDNAPLQPCRWMATFDGGPTLLMDSNILCDSWIDWTGSKWTLQFFSGGVVNWEGEKLVSLATPAGVYAQTGGPAAFPATITIVSIGGATTSQSQNTACQPV